MSEHKYLLRVPLDLWSSIQREASLARRSANSEIVWRLSQSFAPGAPTYPSLAAFPYTSPEGVMVVSAGGYQAPLPPKPPDEVRPDFKGGKP